MRILLLLNGDIPAPALVLRAAARCEAILCADGGARHAARLKLVPRWIVGDMDSLPKPLPRWPGAIFLCDFDEGRSDLEKALDFAAQAPDAELWVAGALGGRLDHALVNLSLLEAAATERPLTLIDRGLGRLLGRGKHALSCRPGETLSLLACGTGAVATFTGVRYPLKRARLAPGARGLSNVATSAQARLELHSGRAWLIRP